MAGHQQEPSWQPNGQEQARAAAWQQPTYATPAGAPTGAPAGSYGYVPDDADPTQGYPAPIWNSQQAYQEPAAAAAPAAPRVRSSSDKGFIASLFDFSFTNLVTPKIIKFLYVLCAAWTVLWAVIFLDYGFHHGTAVGVIFLLIVDPIFILLSLGVSRVILEAFIVVFRIYEETRKIREQGDPVVKSS
jgi:hypothetical protein